MKTIVLDREKYGYANNIDVEVYPDGNIRLKFSDCEHWLDIKLLKEILRKKRRFENYIDIEFYTDGDTYINFSGCGHWLNVEVLRELLEESEKYILEGDFMFGENVTDDELKKDIEKTKLESEAYNHLYLGYYLLSELPETGQYNKKLFFEKSEKYKKDFIDCETFLVKLMGLAETRKLSF